MTFNIKLIETVLHELSENAEAVRTIAEASDFDTWIAYCDLARDIDRLRTQLFLEYGIKEKK